jgi:hypothetical protein
MLKSGQWRALLAPYIPAWLLTKMPDQKVQSWLNNLITMMTQGGEGQAMVLGASATAEGSAGIGGAAAASAGMRGGVLHVQGRAGLTFGLGVGARVDMALGLTDGLAMMGVMALSSGADLYQQLQLSGQMQQYLKQQATKMLGWS